MDWLACQLEHFLSGASTDLVSYLRERGEKTHLERCDHIPIIIPSPYLTSTPLVAISFLKQSQLNIILRSFDEIHMVFILTFTWLSSIHDLA